MEYNKMITYALVPAACVLGLGIGFLIGEGFGANKMETKIEHRLNNRLHSMQLTAFNEKNFEFFDCEIQELYNVMFLLKDIAKGDKEDVAEDLHMEK